MSEGFDVTAPSVLTKKSVWNIYTVLLLIALVSLLLAMLFLYLEIRAYGGFGQVKGAAFRSAPVVDVIASPAFA
ncbi:MAG TPA: hypothetical protein PKC18_02400 [Lacipirellulaceae bacterium]|nr:hypothetical protein [Lacipirellulaceae bacterium]